MSKRYNNGLILSGTLFVVVVLLIVTSLAFTLIGGQFPQLDNSKVGGAVAIVTNPPEQAKNNLQLYTFSGITIAPPIPPAANPPAANPPAATAPSANSGCENAGFELENEILLGSDPAPGTAATSGKVRVWVRDEAPPKISLKEVVDPNIGSITTPGDRRALDTSSDGGGNYLWEPTIYLLPATGNPPSRPFCNAKNTTCTPYFPVTIKGGYDPYPGYDSMAFGGAKKGPAIDSDLTNFQNGPGQKKPKPSDTYFAEYIWDFSSLNLAKGNYWAQFVIHDGDNNVGISCVTLQI